MDRFYDGDQEKMFKEAHVVSPFKKPRTHPIKVSNFKFVASNAEEVREV